MSAVVWPRWSDQPGLLFERDGLAAVAQLGDGQGRRLELANGFSGCAVVTPEPIGYS